MEIFEKLKYKIEGELFTDNLHQIIYATDASAYREKPLAVIYPKNINDLKEIINFAHAEKMPIIPRAAGTSLAGQVVGNGLIVDISLHFTEIIEFNVEQKWVKVQPAVVLDELNKITSKQGLFFGPEASTANRCMFGGMVGNNACGLHSLVYGSTRDHTLAIKGLLSDGSEVEFKDLTKTEFAEKLKLQNLEGEIYRNIYKILSHPENQENIRNQYPDKEIKRRNTGYAIDLLLETEIFSETSQKFNFSKLIAGSEGTLCFVTEIKLNLIPLPPKEKAVVAVHLNTLQEAFRANLIALKYKPSAIELMDKTILDCTKGSIETRKNRFFIEGEPTAILMIEFVANTKEEISEVIKHMETEMVNSDFGYHFPIVWGAETKKVWDLRKAGLGVLSNIPGDEKPESVVEDTAVNPAKLPDYMEEFQQILAKYNLSCVYHAHIGTGELHLRPLLNLKTKEGVELFRTVALETAKLIKKYNGSLSGEHGDGRLRGEFIPIIIGEKNYQLLKEIKKTWDSENIFNPGKIVDTPRMNTNLRYEINQETKDFKTIFDFSDVGGILRAAEKCNGSADCRKSHIIGGTMCPSYMATRDEKNTTRARANTLREFLTRSTKKNPFDNSEIYEVMDLCLSCKACKSECPSGVDVAKLKAEFLQHYYDSHGIPLRTRLIANITKVNKLGSVLPSVFNWFVRNKSFSNFLKKSIGFAKERSIPTLQKLTLTNFAKKQKIYNEVEINENETFIKIVYLFNDEFTNYNDTEIGIKAVELLQKLGYKVIVSKNVESGRTYLSKGMLRKAKKIAEKNVDLLKNFIWEDVPLIGIEPSAILTFRDEYPELVQEELKHAAQNLAKNTFLFDEFFANEIELGNIPKEKFTDKQLKIKLHGHCQQKSVASTNPTKIMLSFPENYSVEEIQSGCCGMAGSFGYEKEHYDISMKIGNLVLFPEIEKTAKEVEISASGTSCRHQIKDGTGRLAKHSIEILWEALA